MAAATIVSHGHHYPRLLRGQPHIPRDMTSFEWIQATASIATAVAVFVAGWQLRLTKRQAITAFEDELARQYREIAQRLPIEALLREESTIASTTVR